MRKGYEQILRNAEMEVEYVCDFIDELNSSTETNKLWRAWIGILEHYTKAVAALRRATDSGRTKAWSDQLLAKQRNDPILHYALQARATFAHVYEQKRDAEPSKVIVGGMIAVSGNSRVILENNTVIDASGKETPLPNGTLEVLDGRYVGGTIPREAVIEKDHYLIVDDLENRSGKWKVPNPATNPEKRAIEIASYIGVWLRQRLSEAKQLALEEKR